MVPILQSASEATWNNMVTGDKDLWEGRGQCEGWAGVRHFFVPGGQTLVPGMWGL